MQAVILAAGRGKRMKHLTKATTKPMLEIKSRPILEYKLQALPKKIKEVIFIVGYHSMHIMSYFKRYYLGKKITYVFQNNINGTGGALHLARSILKDNFMVIMGDDLYSKKDLAEVVKHDLAIMGHEVSDPSLYGMLKVDKRGNLVDIIEKPKRSKDKFANIGLYVLNRKIFDYEMILSKSREFYLTDIVVKMAQDHKIKVIKATHWHPIGTPEDLEEAEKVLHNFI